MGQRKTKRLTLGSIYRRCITQGDCRIWDGQVTIRGYPYMHDPVKWVETGGRESASRSSVRSVVWRVAHGTMPTGRIRMTCGNRLCVFSGHMEDLSHSEISRAAAADGAFDTYAHRIARLKTVRSHRKIDDIGRARLAQLAPLPRSRARFEQIKQICAEYGIRVDYAYKLLALLRVEADAPVINGVWALAGVQRPMAASLGVSIGPR